MGDEWREVAACAETDPELWFPTGGGNGRAGKKICGGCPVQAECLQVALETGDVEHGILGGLSPRDRRKLLDGRRKQTLSVSRESVAALTLAGLSASDIAARLGTTDRTVHRVRAELRDAA